MPDIDRSARAREAWRIVPRGLSDVCDRDLGLSGHRSIADLTPEVLVR